MAPISIDLVSLLASHACMRTPDASWAIGKMKNSGKDCDKPRCAYNLSAEQDCDCPALKGFSKKNYRGKNR
jgi:hypothetical protein